MKKTIIALLALAGTLMADTPTAVALDWNGNTAAIPGATSSVTVAFTLDWNKFKSSTGDCELFSLSSGTDYKQGMGIQDGQYIGSWSGDSYGASYNYSLLDYNTAQIVFPEAPAYFVVVYTLKDTGTNITLREDLYFWDSNKNSLGPQSDDASSTYSQFNYVTPSNITLNSEYLSTDSVKVYTDTYDESAIRLAIAESMLPTSDTPGGSDSPTVPEPATATLSLLALAGLAARRRRR